MTHPPAAGGRRIAWSELPDVVRDWVHTVLGGPVAATSQPRGFSPGSADRVVTAQGHRAFVEAVSSQLNARSAELHRREAVIAALLTAVLAGLAGYFLDVARQPPAPGVPSVRAFQRAQADVVLRWLRRRLEPSAGPDGPS